MEVRQFRVTYVHGPEVQIRNDPAAPKWVDSPHTVLQIFDIAEIQDEIPTIMSIWRTVCILLSHQ